MLAKVGCFGKGMFLFSPFSPAKVNLRQDNASSQNERRLRAEFWSLRGANAIELRGGGEGEYSFLCA